MDTTLRKEVMSMTTETLISIPVSLKPIQGKSGGDRKAWSIPLAGTWLPFFTASNVMGQSNISAAALGAPLRLATDKDGTPKFNKSGMPILRVVKELSDQIRVVRENFAFGLLAYADRVQKARPDEYKAQVEAAQKAGAPLIQKDTDTVIAYMEKVQAQAEKVDPGETATVPTEPQAPAPTMERELVPA